MEMKITRNAIVYGEVLTDQHDGRSIRSFLRRLKERYQRLQAQLLEKDPQPGLPYPFLIESLDLAESLFKREDLGLRSEKAPHQIGVFGPTQVGKSTVLNWLADRDLAMPSPLAGFTVHAQGFSDTQLSQWCELLDRYFDPILRTRRSLLTPETLGCFSLEMQSSSLLPDFLRGTVIWDTPDFDSVMAGNYRESVTRVAGLCDVVVLVLSKDKYGDLTVWNFLSLIAPLGQPTLIVINKTDPSTDQALIQSVAQKWREFRLDGEPRILALPYLPESERLEASSRFHELLRRPLLDALKQIDRRQDPSMAFVRYNWNTWIEPILVEHRLAADWTQKVDEVIQECLDRYLRDYLEHPNHYETFQRALAELLTLLEVPGIGTALHAARRLVTWPIRQLSRLGEVASGHSSSPESIEVGVLQQLARHALIRLNEQLLLDRPEIPSEVRWWNGLSQVLVAQRDQILLIFDRSAQDYIIDFKPEIDRTARSLYAHLQDHPLILNSLRATRVTTDAAALGVALHTGGIGVQDFVIAPAVLSMTSMLAESALGHFMNRAQEQLKQRQREAVQSLLLNALSNPLSKLAESIDPKLSLGITVSDLDAVTPNHH